MSKLEKLEWVLILIAVISLFPVVLSYRAVWYRYCYLGVVLVAMVAVAVIRFKRVRQAFRDRDERK